MKRDVLPMPSFGGTGITAARIETETQGEGHAAALDALVRAADDMVTAGMVYTALPPPPHPGLESLIAAGNRLSREACAARSALGPEWIRARLAEAEREGLTLCLAEQLDAASVAARETAKDRERLVLENARLREEKNDTTKRLDRVSILARAVLQLAKVDWYRNGGEWAVAAFDLEIELRK